MRDSREPSMLADAVHRPAKRQHRVVAAALVACFAAVTVIALAHGTAPGPIAPAFVPICATLWTVADLMTTFLLLSQFAVTGLRAFAFLGATYALVAIVSVPYIIFFPGVFAITGDLPYANVSPFLFFAAHLTFPLLVAAYHLHDPHLTKRSTNRAMTLGVAFAGTLAAGAVLIAVAVTCRHLLPPLIAGGRFTPLLTMVLLPVVAALDVGAVVLICARARKLDALQVWLIVVLIAAALETLLDAGSGGRYTIGWYVGKVEVFAGACVVFVALLLEVSALYRRLGDLAMTDSLTGLRNRRAFDDYATWNIEVARRGGSELAFLVVDIDFFKRYNDRYGHAAGDVCLKRVADVLRASLGRAVDIVARYGGEEFVALLPGATATSARELGERIRSGVANLGIDHGDSAVASVVTVSVGVVHARSLVGVDTPGLFALADKALYRAKERRNSTVLAETGFAASPSELKWQIRLLKNKGA